MKKLINKLLIMISIFSICLNISIFTGYIKIKKKIIVEKSYFGTIQVYEDIVDVEVITNESILDSLVEENKISDDDFNKDIYGYGETKRERIYQYNHIKIKWEK